MSNACCYIFACFFSSSFLLVCLAWCRSSNIVLFWLILQRMIRVYLPMLKCLSWKHFIVTYMTRSGILHVSVLTTHYPSYHSYWYHIMYKLEDSVCICQACRYFFNHFISLLCVWFACLTQNNPVWWCFKTYVFLTTNPGIKDHM